MKKDIHPQYYKETSVECACGNKFKVGSTKPSIKVDICAKCHPFYTGSKQLIDTAGRVEKFKARIAKVKPGKLKKQRIKKQKAENKK